MQNPTTFKHIFIALGPNSGTLFSDKMSWQPFKMKCNCKGYNTCASFPWRKKDEQIHCMDVCWVKSTLLVGKSPLGSSGCRLSWQATSSPLCSHLTLQHLWPECATWVFLRTSKDWMSWFYLLRFTRWSVKWWVELCWNLLPLKIGRRVNKNPWSNFKLVSSPALW